MKGILALALCSLLATSAYASQDERAAVGPCTDQQLLGHVPESSEIESHRTFVLPTIRYPFGTQLSFAWNWGLTLTFRVDATGHVLCYGEKDEFGKNIGLNNERLAAIKSLGAWKYEPFVINGVPTAAIVTEVIQEEELPERHIALPDAPIQQISFKLRRYMCFGECPDYEVSVDGSGHAIYRGFHFVDVTGSHSYSVPVEGVKRLVESLRAKDIWSLRPKYRARITDSSTYVLEMTVGNERHVLEDYVGELIGMPAAVSDFEKEVDDVSGSGMWVHLSKAGVDHLAAEHFNFQSTDGANLLARAIADRGTQDDEAIVHLIQLGAPISGAAAPSQKTFAGPSEPLLNIALRNHRTAVVDELISRGALQTRGQPDSEKMDAAFRAAIKGGRLSLVKRIWDLSGNDQRPSLVFLSISERDKSVTRLSPVTLLLSHSSYGHDTWEGLAIAKWLLAMGSDAKGASADGTTLLHIATESGDTAFVQYLLDVGLDPATPGKYGLPALASAQREDVALMLLRAGTKIASMSDGGKQFRRYATHRHWEQVLAWLAAHEQ